MSGAYYIEPERRGLDRRVFRKLGAYLEWAHYSDWVTNPIRARYYGSQLCEIPADCVEFHLTNL